jgi:amidohydrolase
VDISKRVIEHRRWLHQHPELGFEEYETSDYIAKHLEKAGIPFKRLKTGIIADLNVRASQTFALRADIDALPIQEVEGRPYGSKNPGKMHACGHDAHAAMLLTTAEYMAENPPKRNVRFIFQPAEEGRGGGEYMAENGAVDGVDMVFGIHVWSKTKSGVFEVKAGPLMASASEYEVKITGSGGHAASPHLTVNPIAVGSTLVNELFKMRMLSIDPIKTAVVNVTSFNSGNTYNVVPSTATLMGTIRTFSNEVREKIFQKFSELELLAKSLGAEMNTDIKVVTHPVVNSEEAVKIAKEVLKKLNFESVEATPTMGGEDFSFYLQKVPGAFFFLGVRNEEKGITSPHHSPTFDVDEKALQKGVKFFIELCNY